MKMVKAQGMTTTERIRAMMINNIISVDVLEIDEQTDEMTELFIKMTNIIIKKGKAT